VFRGQGNPRADEREIANAQLDEKAFPSGGKAARELRAQIFAHDSAR